MPLNNDDLDDVRRRVNGMFMDTIATFRLIEENSDEIYGDRAPQIRAAINEYLDDFLNNPERAGEQHPEVLIYRTDGRNFQRAGFYGAQLDLKERQVTEANRTLRERIVGGVRRFWDKPFKKWVDIINNFLGSLASATGLSEALKELKDCLRDELPDDDDEQ